MITSPKTIVEEYAKFYENLIKSLRSSITHKNFKAINVYKKIIPRVAEDMIFKPVTIKEIKKL